MNLTACRWKLTLHSRSDHGCGTGEYQWKILIYEFTRLICIMVGPDVFQQHDQAFEAGRRFAMEAGFDPVNCIQ